MSGLTLRVCFSLHNCMSVRLLGEICRRFLIRYQRLQPSQNRPRATPRATLRPSASTSAVTNLHMRAKLTKSKSSRKKNQKEREIRQNNKKHTTPGIRWSSPTQLLTLPSPNPLYPATQPQSSHTPNHGPSKSSEERLFPSLKELIDAGVRPIIYTPAVQRLY